MPGPPAPPPTPPRSSSSPRLHRRSSGALPLGAPGPRTDPDPSAAGDVIGAAEAADREHRHLTEDLGARGADPDTDAAADLGGRQGAWSRLTLALPLLAVNLALCLVSDLAHHLALALALLAPAFLWLAWAARPRPFLHLTAPSVTRAILAGALLVRLPLLPLPLTLSDDALRYLWDGKVAASGGNPYALAPDADELTPLRDETWLHLPHRQLPTVYPPLSIAAFSIAARLPKPILAWKALATAADLLACALLLALARRLDLPPERTLWYAWNPLVALEVAGMGHVDALGVAAALGAVLCLTGPRRDRSWATAAVWAAAGALAKLAPLAALPMWSRQSGRPGRLLGASLALVAVAGAPVVVAAGGVPPGLAAYARSWDFDGPLFEPLWRLLRAAGAAPRLAHLLDHLKDATGYYHAFNPIYPYLYPQMLAKLLLLLPAAGAIVLSLRWREPARGTGRLFGALLLLSATVYPWYLLWVLPWAALYRQTAWLALSGLILLSYLPRSAGLPLIPWVYLAIWLPFALLLLRGWWMQRRLAEAQRRTGFEWAR